VYISSEQAINAAAIETGDIVVNAGALIQLKNYEELIAILAHEVGHIEGQHIPTLLAHRTDFARAGLVTALLGAVTSICTGNTAPLIAGVMGGTSVGTSMALGKMRQNENIADTKAAEAIKRLKWSVFGGFVSIHEKFASHVVSYNKYFSTHPPSEERISKFRKYYAAEKGRSAPKDVTKLMERYKQMFEIARHKMQALTMPLEQLYGFCKSPKTIPEKYARAIALYRLGKYDGAIDLINQLNVIGDGDKAYYAEIKCMSLINLKRCFEAANIARDILKNDRNTRTHRDLAIIYAAAVVAGNLTAHLQNAAKILRKVLVIHKNDITALNTLGKIYSLSGNQQKASLCAAEVALQMGNTPTAKIHAQKATTGSDASTRRRAQDILDTTEEKEPED
jgi:predicted Zn-dependent protease